MDIKQFLNGMRAAHGGHLPLSSEQERALRHDHRAAPLWIIAGPGTGKTHTLVWLVLKRLLVDRVAPERVFLTTFTRKAATELESRLVLSRQKLVDAKVPGADGFEVTQLCIGTLHSLCSRILQDVRYPPAFRIRVLEDEMAQQFFVRRSSNPLLRCDDISFWSRFGFIEADARFPPNTAARCEAACQLFNRMTENSVDLQAMLDSGDEHLQRLAEAYKSYEEKLTERQRTDQAHLQRYFLDFLSSAEGRAWKAEGFTVLVDEYQDTNPIQEQVYFTLAGAQGDLTVVGDDDQSLYRFRGATVESLVEFDRACQVRLNRKPLPVYLSENRRSHPGIVAWVNRFIGAHPDMVDTSVRVRAPGKPALSATSDILGAYKSVWAIAERKTPDAATKVVSMIRDLKREGLVQDYSQIALLSFSTRETSHSIGTYTKALREAKIPLYNPRSNTAHKDERFLGMLGALSNILDPDSAYQDSAVVRLPNGVIDYVDRARSAYAALAPSHPELARYVDASIQAVRRARYDGSKDHNYLTRQGGRRVTGSGLLYKLLAHEPFASELTDPEGGERLKVLNLVLAEYESLFYDGELKLEPGEEGTRLFGRTLQNFYGVFAEGVHDGLNDPEDDEISIIPGQVNVMTIHQAKGLEFEVVFVLRPDKQPFVGSTHILEDELDPYVRRLTRPPHRRSQELRAAEDTVRLYFVAYSRAKRLLVLVGHEQGKWDRALGRAEDGRALTTKAALQAQGVYFP
ncbi:UvrD-helicase domain-containing protein [Myxococcus sp. RHSTA-1-4]|uniref:UvrD-helicase domain-containing protein n=1 Tax=Myxococcus sp. RHSTA-1-4 TaxID=2874601 RepID=UPI001CBA7616|nr:ATP-dependent helicase [Myxococcus sp. RHSTA-1-4]MBZ4418754.1 ATP-dependent helicase [Myxococcus sp. RHSTA-1-4]